jgi:hypothetical protein
LLGIFPGFLLPVIIIPGFSLLAIIPGFSLLVIFPVAWDFPRIFIAGDYYSRIFFAGDYSRIFVACDFSRNFVAAGDYSRIFSDPCELPLCGRRNRIAVSRTGST